MNTQPQTDNSNELPIGHQAAYELLVKSGGLRNHSPMTYLLPAVSSIFVEKNYRWSMVKNPDYKGIKKHWEPEYISGTVRDLSSMIIDGIDEGKLHGDSEKMAKRIRKKIAKSGEPIDLVISGHFTSSGWYIDTVRIKKAAVEAD